MIDEFYGGHSLLCSRIDTAGKIEVKSTQNKSSFVAAGGLLREVGVVLVTFPLGWLTVCKLSQPAGGD
jgi:hypothetical protein